MRFPRHRNPAPGGLGRSGCPARTGPMSLHRFCCPDSRPEGDRVRIEGAAAAQIRKVLRLGPGDQVVLFGADEWEYTVRLECVERDAALGAIVARSAPRAEPQCDLTLAVALLKGEKTEW